MKRAVVGILLCLLVAGAAGAASAGGAPSATDAPVAETPNVTVDDESLELHSDANQTISGTVDAASNATVTAALVDQSNFVSREVASVEDGRFTATYNLSDLEPGTTLDGKVAVDGDVVIEFQTEIVDEGNGSDSTNESDTSDDDADQDDEESSDDMLPGFGIVPALVGLLAARRLTDR
ncbi:BGTF surface domain-containing protein [Natronoarchaeum rubrum]|uniref:BGTF surface domain-containing protein n=1 Tax=Natronoarchaeum rubrum TaxID=755311 RepID=UPI002110FC29|nr:BGTF surface domain-containing protein [Natronoarchaeum rubrum]